ncbi:MAG: (2Fe-2S)-binding protein [Alphaproteobacteria bacterium]
MPRLTRDARHRVTFTLNGREVVGEAEPRMLLSDFLRQVLGATGTHVGCEHGVCGACTVRIDGVAARSCLSLAVQVEGCRVDTVEGLADADGQLSPLQAAFKRNRALQCGYCTAGILMSLSALLERNPAPDEAALLDAIGGHLCRCTGYADIVRAAREAAGLGADA